MNKSLKQEKISKQSKHILGVGKGNITEEFFDIVYNSKHIAHLGDSMVSKMKDFYI